MVSGVAASCVSPTASIPRAPAWAIGVVAVRRLTSTFDPSIINNFDSISNNATRDFRRSALPYALSIKY